MFTGLYEHPLILIKVCTPRLCDKYFDFVTLDACSGRTTWMKYQDDT